MSLYAVQNFTAETLNGLVVLSLPPLLAVVQPPPVTQSIEQPIAYVWGGKGQERRATLPRDRGQKRTLHQIDIYLNWIAQIDNEDLVPELFPILLDQVLGALRSVDLKAQASALVDPASGAQSSLTDFGENMNWAYERPLVIGDPGSTLQFNSAQIKISAYEWLSPA